MALERRAISTVLLAGTNDLLELELLEGLRQLMQENCSTIRVPEELSLSAAEH